GGDRGGARRGGRRGGAHDRALGRDMSAAAAWSRPAPRRVRAIRDRLRTVYGRPIAPPHGRPLDELVLTVLSQSTNDRNRDVAYLRLTRALPTWEAVREAPVEVVEEAIRPGGIAKVKSARVQVLLRANGEPRS